MSLLVSPHGGGDLRPLLLGGEARVAEHERAGSLPRVPLSSREAGDLIMLGIGGFTPLAGFMGRDDHDAVCDGMHTADGLFWPIPITLSATAELAGSLREGEDVALYDPRREEILGVMELREKYRIDAAAECRAVFGTDDPDHPGVRQVRQQGEVNLAGPVRVLSEGGFREDYPGIYMTPAETRAEFERRGWASVAAFQTRNPMHRSHEYLVRIAAELCDGVMVHSLLGRLKPGDVPAPVRQRAISALLDNYLVRERVLQAGYPLDMRYAGPREALLHALFRQNYGCAYLIVGRDHAGVGDYYGPFDAQAIFDRIPEDALQTRPLRMDWTFWCDRCEGMASLKTCPHGEEDRVLLSGSKLRKLLSEGKPVPEHFSRPEVLDELRAYYESLSADERVPVSVSGHSAR